MIINCPIIDVAVKNCKDELISEILIDLRWLDITNKIERMIKKWEEKL